MERLCYPHQDTLAGVYMPQSVTSVYLAIACGFAVRFQCSVPVQNTMPLVCGDPRRLDTR